MEHKTKLSVNINKIATLRNSRGGNNPDLIRTALDIERYGADGITIHPRPDERHIRYSDVPELKKVLTTELNIEGNCREAKFVQLVLDCLPAQVTLVPDTDNQLTSNHGWDTLLHKDYLKEMIALFKSKGIRTSIFVDPLPEMVAPYKQAAQLAVELGLGINAGHDLDHQNLRFFSKEVPGLLEVSIGHALICDALYWGLENTVQLYKRQLME
jgi:pyridoxine 5-phosphate synthase